MTDEEPTREYESTVVSPAQLLLGVLSGVAVALVLEALNPGLWPFAIVVFLAASAVGYYLAPVTVSVAGPRLTIAQGRGEKEPRVIYLSEIRESGVRRFSFGQYLGSLMGVGADERTTRLVVRPGAALVLVLHDGEQLQLSVGDADAAMRALEPALPDVLPDVPGAPRRPRPPRPNG